MKQTLALTAAAILFLLGLAFAQDPPQESTESKLTKRIEVLEREVATMKKEVEASKTLVEETTRYLAGAKERSDALLQTFDESEKLGFTAGINFDSRKVLLAGLRAYVRGEAEGLPGAKKPAPADTGGR